MNNKKIVHLSFSRFGGAGRAAWRLHEAMLAHGFDSFFITRDESNGVVANRHIGLGLGKPLSIFERILVKAKHLSYRKNHWIEKKQAYQDYVEVFPKLSCEIATLPFGHVTDIIENQHFREAEIVVLHWVANMFDNSELMFHLRNKKVVWTLHDMNPLKGLFHYQHDEDINSESVKNFDAHIRNIKHRSLQQLKHLRIVSPSKWLAGQAATSEITRSFPVYNIPYSLNLDVFHLQENRQQLKKEHGYNDDDVVVLFIAESLANYRKGFDLLEGAIRRLEHIRNVKFIAIGNKPAHFLETARIKFVPKIADDQKLVAYYNLADCFVIPSREDNLPNVILEALACGCPVIGFNTGGIGDHVLNLETGILADEISEDGLIQALISFVENREQLIRQSIRDYAVLHFSSARQADAYARVFNDFEQERSFNFFRNVCKTGINYLKTKFLRHTFASRLTRV